MTFFWFPQNVNEHGARITGCLVSIVSILGIIFRDSRVMWWAIAAMFGDFICRFLAGGRASILGTVADLISSFLPIKMTTGSPKQFAQFVGVCFAGISTLLLFLDTYGTNIAGCVVLGCLAAAAALEGLGNICLGCLFFSYVLVPIGIISPQAVESDNDAYEEQVNFLEEEVKRVNPEEPQPAEHATPGHEQSEIRLRYKRRNDDQERESFDLIKHTKITYFASTMGLTGLAVMWKYAHDSRVFEGIPKGIHSALTIFSVCWFAFLMTLYLLRAIMYPQKIYKEWMCEIRRNFLAVPLITLLLFSYLTWDEQTTLAKVQFWIAAPALFLYSLICAARWFREPHFPGTMHPAWMIPILGNLVAAFLAPTLDSSYREVGWLWFSWPLFHWITLTVLIMNRMTFMHQLDDKQRPATFILIAAPSMCCAAYVSLLGSFDNFARFLFYVSLASGFVNGVLVAMRFYGNPRFDMSYWGYLFPLVTLGLVNMVYHNVIGSGLTQALAYIFFIIPNWMAALLTLHTAAAFIRKTIFVMDDKYGPLSFMKIFHYALRDTLPILQKKLNKVDPNDQSTITQFCDFFDLVGLTFTEHADHEENVIFPQYQWYFPEVIFPCHQEHVNEGAAFAKVQNMVDQLRQGAANPQALVAQIQPEMEQWISHMYAHLDHEELDLNPIPRKYVPMKIHMRLTRKAWYYTGHQKWRRLLPFLIENLSIHQRRIRLINCLRWAAPEHTQTIGMMLYDGLQNRYIWDRLVEVLPEIKPRPLSGWQRYH